MNSTVQMPQQPSADDSDPRHRADPAPAVASAKTPVSSATLTVLGLVWAVALIGLGAVAVHDVLVATQLVGPPAWISAVVDWVGRLRPDVPLIVAATVVGLIGLVLIFLALRPRRKRGFTVGAEAGTFVRRRHLSRLLSARVRTLDGVVDARTTARRRKVEVLVRGVDGVDSGELHRRVRTLVDDELALLDKNVRSDVQIRQGSS